MKLNKFKSEEAYLMSQVRTQRRRAAHAHVAKHQINAIYEWLSTNWSHLDPCWVSHGDFGDRILRGICHGSMSGEEVQFFRELDIDAIGTDLVPRGDDVIEHDFRQRNDEWIGEMDFVYSNSLDHSDNPKATLAVWMEQLGHGGVCFIDWSHWDNKLGSGDCFAASLDEYLMLCASVGEIIDIIYLGTDYHGKRGQKGTYFLNKPRCSRVVIVIQKRAQGDTFIVNQTPEPYTDRRLERERPY